MSNPNQNPNLPVPAEFVDVLQDNDMEDDPLDDNELVEVLVEVEGEDGEEVENEELAYADLPIYEAMDDGVLVPLGAPPEEEFFDAESSSDEEEIRQARVDMQRAISPLTLRAACPEPAFIVGEVSQSPRARPAMRGRGRGGRGGRGRGGGRGGQVRRRLDAWVRGEPLVEKYVRDDELPDHLRQEISQLLADRRARSVRRAARRAAEEERNAREMNGEEQELKEFGDAEEFVWQPMDEWRGMREPFQLPNPGPTSRFETAYDAFRAFWDDNILNHIVRETNSHAQGIANARARFRRDWYETNLDEILCLFAFWMMLGVIRMPTIKSCFSKIPLLRTGIFQTLLQESRYWNLNAALHFAGEARRGQDDVLHPIQPILDHLNKKFKEHYKLHQEICIDESLTLWKGPVAFKQYIKTKAARFGIKTYQLCESATGYLWSFFVYIGRGTHENWTLPVSVSTVRALITPLLRLGHTLFMDNWFNSPLLARFLKRNQTDCVGTLRPNRQHVPLEVQRARLSEGEFVARQSGDVMVASVQDRKRVSLISTYHGVSQTLVEARPGRPAQYKLDLVHDYNRGMGGVDRLDQMLEPFLVERKQCANWTKKLFKRLLNISIQNARILVEQSSGAKVDALAFRLALVQQIMDHHLAQRPARPDARRRNVAFHPGRLLTDCHFISPIPITDEERERRNSRTNLGRQYCVWCAERNDNRKKKTRYHCPDCEVALCLENCFAEYHTTP